MTHKHIFKVIGNGDCRCGKALDEEVSQRLIHARTKHPVFARDAFEALNVISAELDEVYEAESEGDMEQYRYELVDVMAMLVRAYNREWDQHGAA